jgi:hypothetical protein
MIKDTVKVTIATVYEGSGHELGGGGGSWGV